MCESMIEKLAQSTTGSSLVVKREESEGSWPGSEWDMEWGRKKGKSKEEEEMEEENADLAGWREGGNLRTEWLKKDRRVFFFAALFFCITYFDQGWKEGNAASSQVLANTPVPGLCRPQAQVGSLTRQRANEVVILSSPVHSPLLPLWSSRL